MADEQKRLGEILIEKGLIRPDQLEGALEEQRRTGDFLGEVLLRRTGIRERDLLEALSKQFNVTFVDLKNRDISWELIKEFSSALILDYKCLPLEKKGSSVTMAITNPLDMKALKKAEEEAKNMSVKLALVTKKQMQEFIKSYQKYMKRDISKFFE